MAAVPAAAKQETLDAVPEGLLALAANSHRGHQPSAHTLHPALAFSKPPNATGLPVRLYDFRGGPRCTGKERDAETGLDYFLARYYSSVQGRFTSPDEPLLDQFENDPQSWNLYSYVRNNPLTFVDPNGEDCIYTNNFNQDGTVSVERGNCSQKGGTFVDGTIDVKSITYNARRNELGYSYVNEAAGTSGAGILGLSSAPQGALSPFGQQLYNEMSARRDASNEFIGTFMVSSAAVGATGGAIAYFSGATSGSGLTTLGLRSGHGAFRLVS